MKWGFSIQVVAQEDDRGQNVVEAEVAEGDLVQPVLQLCAGCPEFDGGNLQASDDEAGHVEKGAGDPAQAATLDIGVVAAGEIDGEVQDQGGLKGRGEDVAPVDHPVEGIELAGVVEGVEDERDQTEDEEMEGLRGRPAAEEDVEADGEIDQRDDALNLVDAAVGGLENDLNVELGDALEVVLARQGPEDGVGGVGPDAVVIDDVLEGRDARGGVVVDGDEDVSLADAGALAGGVGGDAGGAEAVLGLDPTDAVGGDVEVVLVGEIDAGEDTDRKGGDCEGNGQNTSLEGSFHWAMGSSLHIECQMEVQ